MTVNGDLLLNYKDFVTGAVSAFLPLIATVIGVFLAFAIANLVRHLIIKIAK
jgi:hypothetical protein